MACHHCYTQFSHDEKEERLCVHASATHHAAAALGLSYLVTRREDPIQCHLRNASSRAFLRVATFPWWEPGVRCSSSMCKSIRVFRTRRKAPPKTLTFSMRPVQLPWKTLPSWSKVSGLCATNRKTGPKSSGPICSRPLEMDATFRSIINCLVLIWPTSRALRRIVRTYSCHIYSPTLPGARAIFFFPRPRAMYLFRRMSITCFVTCMLSNWSLLVSLRTSVWKAQFGQRLIRGTS
mmetsp:Transcript_4656/g.8866  ORF Transcript_4656/g.8866 Transcript_4656/m.8866 type:complete len:236 (+) Transcript_4656:34-741(+)